VGTASIANGIWARRAVGVTNSSGLGFATHSDSSAHACADSNTDPTSYDQRNSVSGDDSGPAVNALPSASSIDSSPYCTGNAAASSAVAAADCGSVTTQVTVRAGSPTTRRLP
jgi:hypothetical protein